MSATNTVVITGAAGALGRAVAAAFLARQARLVLIDRELSFLQKAFPELAGNSQHLLLAADVTDEASMAQAAQKALGLAGGVSAVVHVAGGFTMGETVATLSRQTWDGMLNLNAWSFVATAKPFIEPMKKAGGGAIVAVTARGAAVGAAQMSAYVASKSALQRLVESLSAEVRDAAIRVNSVAPSIIDTPANRAAMPDADASRWVPPADLAETIAFLASPAAASIHGQHVVVAGQS